LDAAAVASVEAHLRECAACRDEARALAETWRELQAMPSDSAPRERLFAVRAKALAFVGKTATRPVFSWRRVAIASAVGCVAVLAAAALMFPTVRKDTEHFVKSNKPAVVADQFWAEAKLLEAEIEELRYATQTNEFADLFSLTVQQVERDLQRLGQSDF
jgi:anti-sigma factor RsiW